MVRRRGAPGHGHRRSHTLSWRLRLLLLATAVGVLVPYLVPYLRRLELRSYDQRLLEVRLVRGNLLPHRDIRLFGVNEALKLSDPGWDAEREARIVREVLEEAKPAAVWVDPRLLQDVPGVLSTRPPRETPDADGVVRRVDLVQDGKYSPALSLYAALQGSPIVEEGDLVRVGERVFPRRLAVDFPAHGLQRQGATTYHSLEPMSMRLLNDREHRQPVLETLPGTAVLFADHTMEARYVFKTPVGSIEPHQLEFAALDTLLSGWVLKRLPLPVDIALVGLAIFGIAALTFFLHNPVATSIAWLLLAALYWQAAIWFFVHGWWIPVVPVLVGSLVGAAVVAAGQRLRAVQLMTRMLGEERAHMAAAGDAALGGSERPVTILFTNLPNSIKDLEKSDPEESIRARNRYNELATEAVRRHLGWTLDYQGDAQMVGFSVERMDPDHALHAVRAAMDLHEVVSRAYPEESIHCGVNTGPAAVGLVGAPGAKALAAIGDTTNVAARMMGAAMKQQVPVLISAPTYELCSTWIAAHELPPVSLKGKTAQVRVYAVEGER